MTAGSETSLLELEHVSVHFEGLRALDDVSFAVSLGEIVGLIGPNGAGKTTAFNVACGFVKPTQGHVHYPSAGKSNLRPNQLVGAGVARTLQGVGLFPHCTVLENVMAGGHLRPNGGFIASFLALPNEIRSERALRRDALAMLDRLRITDMAGRLPSAAALAPATAATAAEPVPTI